MSATAPPIAASGASPSTAMCSLDGEMPEKRSGRDAAVMDADPRAAPLRADAVPFGVFWRLDALHSACRQGTSD